MLAAGRGVAKDDVEAARWYRKAAEQGQPMAQASLGACYLYGLGVEKDSVQAHAWLTRGVAGGFERAKPVLAQLEKSLSPSERARSKRLVEQAAAAH
jgi:TPR repeat protein